jgi:hypothetical protein
MNRRSFLAGSASILAFGGTPRSTRPNQADQEKRKEITSVIQQASVPLTTIHRIQADGITVFYREAGPANAPVVLLLHGFPTSSFQYRELIPRLADRYRVIAPDLPGFGFTEVPPARITNTPLIPWLTRFLTSPTRCTSIATLSIFSTMELPRACVWRWPVLSASPRSFHKMETLTKKD